MSVDHSKLRNEGSLPKSNGETDIQLRLEAQKLGMVGALLGARENAALYVASAIIVLVLLLLGTLIFFGETVQSDLVMAIGAIGITVSRYIGGLLKK